MKSSGKMDIGTFRSPWSSYKGQVGTEILMLNWIIGSLACILNKTCTSLQNEYSQVYYVCNIISFWGNQYYQKWFSFQVNLSLFKKMHVYVLYYKYACL